MTDSLQKLRMDRHGVPIDLPERVEWGHVIAPAFQQRKVVRLMEEAQQHLAETMSHLEHEAEEHPELDPKRSTRPTARSWRSRRRNCTGGCRS